MLARCSNDTPSSIVDAIVVAADLIQSYQQIVSPQINPLDPAVITIGTINGGDANNIIASRCTLSGTVRAFSTNVFSHIKSEMEKINRSLEIHYDCTIEFSLPPMYPPVINDKILNNHLKSIVGTNYVELQPYMLAEDFSYYQQVIPGLFFFLGTDDGENNHPLHSPYFNFDTDVLLIGNEIFYQFLKL